MKFENKEIKEDISSTMASINVQILQRHVTRLTFEHLTMQPGPFLFGVMHTQTDKRNLSIKLHSPRGDAEVIKDIHPLILLISNDDCLQHGKLNEKRFILSSFTACIS